MKQRVEDLAIFGGLPTFDSPLHVGQRNVGDRTRLFERFNELLDRRWFTNQGPCAEELEQRLAEAIGVKHVVAVSSGTVGLEMTARALGLGGEVIVPSFTFVATANALKWQEIEPVFCDIGRETHNLDPERVESLITPRTTGILATHVWGRPCDTERLGQIAEKHGIKLLFDAAHAFHCSRGGRMVGNFGSAEVFSFHATKILNAFEGGAVATNDDALARDLALVRNFGFSGYDDVVRLGTNGKMSEASAAMALTSLDSLDGFVEVNYRHYRRYRALIEDLAGVEIVEYDEKEACNYQYVVVEVDECVAELRRDELVEVLHRENVLARRYFYPGCHRMEPYRSLCPSASERLPETERVASRVVCLPTGTSLTSDDIEVVGNLVRFVVSHGGDVSKRLQESAAVARARR